ncbi:MAG: hypothetical protein ACI4L9_05905 [Candidatus Coproplasma sp.]
MSRDKLLYGEVKYKPEFSYVLIKYVAIFSIVAAQIAVFLMLESSIFGNSFSEFTMNTARFVQQLGRLTMPLLFLWMCSYVFSFKYKTFKMFIFYGIVTVVFYVCEILLIIYRVIPFIDYMTEYYIGFSFGKEMLLAIAGYLSNFNVFLDLFLCCGIYYFSISTPKRIKTRKGLIIFRCCAIIPALYIVTAIILGGLMKMGVVSANFYAVAFFPRKRVVNYMIFGSLLLFIKFREKLFNKFGPKNLTFIEYEKTNRCSANFSIMASVIFAIIAGVDTLLGLIPNASHFGIGNSLTLMLAIPFILLHDFGRRPKNKFWTVLIIPYYVVNYYMIFMMYVSLCLGIIAMFSI